MGSAGPTSSSRGQIPHPRCGHVERLGDGLHRAEHGRAPLCPRRSLKILGDHAHLGDARREVIDDLVELLEELRRVLLAPTCRAELLTQLLDGLPDDAGVGLDVGQRIVDLVHHHRRDLSERHETLRAREFLLLGPDAEVIHDGAVALL